MIIYEAMYNPMVEESADCTLSLHKTRAGAEKAIEAHKAQIKKEFENGYWSKLSDKEKELFKDHTWDMFKSWDIHETELLD